MLCLHMVLEHFKRKSVKKHCVQPLNDLARRWSGTKILCFHMISEHQKLKSVQKHCVQRTERIGQTRGWTKSVCFYMVFAQRMDLKNITVNKMAKKKSLKFINNKD